MEFNFGSLIDVCSHQTLILMVQRWKRLRNIFDESKSYEILKKLKQENNLHILEQLNKEEIEENFGLFPIRYKNREYEEKQIKNKNFRCSKKIIPRQLCLNFQEGSKTQRSKQIQSQADDNRAQIFQKLIKSPTIVLTARKQHKVQILRIEKRKKRQEEGQVNKQKEKSPEYKVESSFKTFKRKRIISNLPIKTNIQVQPEEQKSQDKEIEYEVKFDEESNQLQLGDIKQQASQSQDKNDENILEDLNIQSQGDYPDNRLQKELLDNMKQFKAFTSLTAQDITDVVSRTINYKSNYQILRSSYIPTSMSKLSNKRISNNNVFDFIQLVDSALYALKGQRLRQTQIISLLLFLTAKAPKILLQILTGQGKSTTISCLAAILAITGAEVDIATTNDLLAKRDVDQKRQFYSLLGIKVDHNFEENQHGNKQCYRGNTVVYGTPHSFQVDILFDQYKKRGTRCNRPYNVLIIDEVDFMFIDQNDHQTLLSSTFPGFSELIHPMKLIWQKINFNPIFTQNKQLKMAIAVGDHTVTGRITDIMQEAIKDIKQKYKNEIIPDWRMQFINISLQKWIESAIKAAFILKENQNYLVRDKKIVIINYDSDGSLHQKSKWSNGLHQFLQIKHSLPISVEGMTSNFISNLGHFDKYSSIYGLTGTLGSENARGFLKEAYHTEMMRIPPFVERKLKIEPGSILYDEGEWANYICQRIKTILSAQRSILVLCESIQEVDQMNTALEINRILPNRIQFLRTGQQQIDDQIDCGEIFLATNLAGRGADFKISKNLNLNGGLHVIIGFMPSNSRVQLQGRGRAGRNGANGSSQLAVNYRKYLQSCGAQPKSKDKFLQYGYNNPCYLLQSRNANELNSMKQDNKKVYKLRQKDKIFQIYSDGVNKIPDFHLNSVKEQAIEEKWAMLLKNYQNQEQIDYSLFQKNACDLVQNFITNSEDFYNPNHLIGRGINYLCDNKRQEAIQMFEYAQKDNMGSIPQIIGGTYAACTKLNMEKEDSQKIKHSLEDIRKTQSMILHRKELIKGNQIMDLQNKRITDINARIQDNSQKQFEMKVRGNQDQMNRDSQMNMNFSLKPAQISTGEERILEGLNKHLDDVITKYQNLQKNQYVDIQFQAISKILETIDGDEDENQQALNNLRAEGLQFLPIPVVKKRQVPFWKRCLIFVLGVAQIIVGAVLIAATQGIMASMGVQMLMKGAKFCFDSIFKPEQLSDLQKYFTETALSYAFSIACAGLQRIETLGQLMSRGFGLIQMPLGQYIQKKIGNEEVDFENIKRNYFQRKNGQDHTISSGLSNMLKSQKQNNLRRMISNPARIVQNSKNKQNLIWKKAQKQNKKIDQQYGKKRQEFIININKIIRRHIDNIKDTLIQQIKNLPLNTGSILNRLISEAIKDKLNLPQKGQKLKEIISLMKKAWKDPRICQIFLNHVEFSQNVQICLQNIPKCKGYNGWIQKGQIQVIRQAMNSLKLQRHGRIESQRQTLLKQYEYLNSEKGRENVPVDVFNRKVSSYKQSQGIFNTKVNKYNEFINGTNGQQLLQFLRQKKAINCDGKLCPLVIRSLQLPEFTIEALTNVRYCGAQDQFDQVLQAAFFNVIGNYGLRIMDRIFQELGQSQEQNYQEVINDLIN